MATESEWSAAEAALGRAFPDSYRTALPSTSGWEVSAPNAYLALWSLEDVVRFNCDDTYGVAETFPDLILIGTDGGGELVTLDVGRAHSPVVLLNMIASSTDRPSDQGRSFSDWLVHLDMGGELVI